MLDIKFHCGHRTTHTGINTQRSTLTGAGPALKPPTVYLWHKMLANPLFRLVHWSRDSKYKSFPNTTHSGSQCQELQRNILEVMSQTLLDRWRHNACESLIKLWWSLYDTDLNIQNKDTYSLSKECVDSRTVGGSKLGHNFWRLFLAVNHEGVWWLLNIRHVLGVRLSVKLSLSMGKQKGKKRGRDEFLCETVSKATNNKVDKDLGT